MFRRLQSESGATAVYFAVVAPVLIGFAALGSEVGYWLVTDRKLQHIADLSAYSAATRSVSTSDEDLVEEAAKARAQSSGLLATDTFTVEMPPISGANAGQNGFVAVTVTRVVPRYLTSIFSSEDTSVTISARAVAGILPGSGEPVCMLALSQTASQAFYASGAGTINVVGCGFSSNSSSAQSFYMQGARVSVTGSCLYAVGGVVATSGLELTDCTVPHPLSRPTPDPYADLRMLTTADVGGLVSAPTSLENTSFAPSSFLIDFPDLPIARFAGGLSLRGDVTLAPGLYIVDGGTFRIGANSVITGTGVNFYLMNGARLDVAGGAELNLTAYSATQPGVANNPYANLLFFADRSGTLVDHSLSGNSDSSINGVIYLPNDKLTYTGDSGSSYPCIEVIAGQLAVSGSGTMTIGCEPLKAPGSPRPEAGQRVALVE